MSQNELSGSLVIKRASVADAQAIISLSVTTFFETFEGVNDPEHMKQYHEEEMNEAKLTAEMADDGNFFFVASLDNTPVGYAKLRDVKTPAGLEGTSKIELERLYVLQQYHDRKAGAALMRHCIDYAQQNGYEVLWLGVWEHNTRAINFYNKWGFRVFGSHIFRLGSDEQTDLLMRLELTPAP